MPPLQTKSRANVRERLVKIARIASASESDIERRGARRLMRWMLQELSGELLPLERVAKCCKSRVPHKLAEIWRNVERKTATYKNLMQCASVWHCPQCSSKITEKRRLDLSEMIAESPHMKAMVTFTLAHNAGMSLDDLMNALSGAFRKLKSGRQWQKFEIDFQIVGSIRATEVTDGKATGWHPHFHVLFFFNFLENNKPKNFETTFARRIADAWGKAVSSQSIYSRRERAYASLKYGTYCIFDQSMAIQKYIAKSGTDTSWGLDAEMTKSPSKLGKKAREYTAGNIDQERERYTGFQLLLESALSADAEEIRWFENRFIEYAAIMKGKHQLQYSPGLREMFGMSEPEPDQSIVELQEDNLQLFWQFTDAEWSKVLSNKARGMLLEIAAGGSIEKMRVYLESLGIKTEHKPRKVEK